MINPSLGNKIVLHSKKNNNWLRNYGYDSDRLTGQMTYQELQQQIDKELSTSNLPYAIRLQGTFPSLKVRSSHKQTPPYGSLNEVQQIIFELQNVHGYPLSSQKLSIMVAFEANCSKSVRSALSKSSIMAALRESEFTPILDLR